MPEHWFVDHPSLEPEYTALCRCGEEDRTRPCHGRLVGSVGGPDRRHLVGMDARRRAKARRGGIARLAIEALGVVESDVHGIDGGFAPGPSLEEDARAGIAGDVAIAPIGIPGRRATEEATRSSAPTSSL